MVNRLWKLVFGQALVTTPDDFGSQGAWPTHPELLDWLACEFVDDGWDIKAMLKRMVMTETYRQSSAAPEIDSPARSRPTGGYRIKTATGSTPSWFAMAPSPVAACSPARSAARASSPTNRPGYWVFLNFPRRDYVADKGENQYRRALYTYWQRTFLHPSLLAFDASTREECVVQRPRSNTPLQALVLLNDPSYVEAARGLAARVIREGGATRGRGSTGRFDWSFRAPPGPRRPPCS